MAKITANGCTEVARYLATNAETGAQITLVLRSDRAVLRRYRGEYGGSYTIIAKLKERSMADGPAVLVRIATKLGYTEAR